jgi:hypothetical protein
MQRVLESVAGVIFSDISLFSDRSQDSAVGITTGYGLDDRGVGVRVLVGAIIFSKSSGWALGVTQLSIQWVPGVKRSGREVAEVKKTWVYTSTPPYAFMA